MEKAEKIAAGVMIAFVGSFLCFIVWYFISTRPPKPVMCEDDQARNYEEEGVCKYPVKCEDSRATNMGDEGDCIYPEGCPYYNALNYDPDAVEANGSCIFVNNDNGCDAQDILAAKYKLADTIGITPGELDGWVSNFFVNFPMYEGDRARAFVNDDTITVSTLTDRQIAAYMTALLIFNFDCTDLAHIMWTVNKLEKKISSPNQTVEDVANETFPE